MCHIVGCKELDDVHSAISTHCAFVPAANVILMYHRKQITCKEFAYTILPLADTSAHAPLFTEHVPSLAKHST